MNKQYRMVKCIVQLVAAAALLLGLSLPVSAKDLVRYTIGHTKLSPNVMLTQYYADGDLRNIRITNSGEPIQVHVNHESYMLGTNDKVDIDMPNLTAFFIDVRPMPLRLGHTATYSPVGKTFMVRPPAQTNITVQKSHDYKEPTPIKPIKTIKKK